jgi:hypothetical protein
VGWGTLRWPLLAVTVLLAVAVVDVGLRSVPAIRALQQGRDAAEQARILLVGDLSHIDRQRIDQADALLVSAAADFGTNSSILADGRTQASPSTCPGQLCGPVAPGSAHCLGLHVVSGPGTRR